MESIADCQNAFDQLSKTKKFALSLDKIAVGSVYDNAELMRSWYDAFSSYEGRTVRFDYGYFSPIAESAQITKRNAASLRSDFQVLHQNLNRLMSELELCLK